MIKISKFRHEILNSKVNEMVTFAQKGSCIKHYLKINEKLGAVRVVVLHTLLGCQYNGQVECFNFDITGYGLDNLPILISLLRNYMLSISVANHPLITIP